MADTDRPQFDAELLAREAVAHGLVVVAGAGLSMGSPSSLPGWKDINDAFLETLAMRLAVHGSSELAPAVLQLVRDRRDHASVAQPDLQAQLAEESLGEQYFRLFTPLDIDAWNDGHASIAALAATGNLRAVVTTNFDQLIERAIAAAGGRADVYCSPDDFKRMAQGLVLAHASGAIPVIKVHGSVDRTATMVDTLRQRVVGRPHALEAALTALFSDHAVLVVGFSAADLEYDPHYLGLRRGAGRSPSFTVVNHRGTQPNAAMVDLVEASGPRARLVDGTLPESLIEGARALGYKGRLTEAPYDVEREYPGLRRVTLPSRVDQAWTRSISPVSAAVVLASIARAAGSEDAAFRLLMDTMPHHLKAGLTNDPALPAQLNMIAGTLIEACHVDAGLSGDAFSGESALRVLSLKDVAWDAQSLALRSLALALCGSAPESDGLGVVASRLAHQSTSPAFRADVLCTLARAWTLAERWSEAWPSLLRQTYDTIAEWGDEPRRARVGTMLTRFLVATGQLDAAREVVTACQGVVRRLNLAVLGNDLMAATGRLYLAEGRYDKALAALASASRHCEASQQNLRLIETSLPLAEAAAAAGDRELLQAAFQHFDRLAPLVPGLALPHAASRVRLFCRAGAFDEARAAVDDLRSLAERWGGHPWVPDLAARLDRQIAASIALE